MMKTNEGGKQFEHSLNHALELFSKGGSLFVNKRSFYGNEESALSLFQKSWITDKETSLKLLLWLRDARGGAGNRSGFRECVYWLAENGPEWIKANIEWIPEVGRWDDLRSLFNTPLERDAAKIWARAIMDGNVLAAKWADRKDKPVKHEVGIKKEGKFRKLLASLRKNNIVEHKMSTSRFNEIEYHTVPSLAMARYTNAFQKNDTERFEGYKESLKKGETTVNASVLFPHDCVRTVKYGESDIADAQFDALPNYMEGTNERIICIPDTSGSMGVAVAGKILAVDVSQALALYCSAKIQEDSPFYKKFIPFCSESQFVDWDGMKFSDAVNNRRIFDGAIGSTRIDTALDLILKTAKFFKLSNDYIPTTLMIISDMQFHSGNNWPGMSGTASKDTEVEKCLKRWDEAGYNRPKIVYWNVAGYAGSPATVKMPNTALISGFSPSVLKAVLSGEDFTPLAVMNRALEKYKINMPKSNG